MDNKNKSKSTNVDDYIANLDEDIVKENRKKPLFLIFSGLGALSLVGICSYIAMHPLQKEVPVFNSVTEEPAATEKDNSASSGFSIDLPILGKDKKEKDLSLPRYTNFPSDEILNADPLSGQVQIADWIFDLPCKLTAFTDAGFTIYALGPDEKDIIGGFNESVAQTTLSRDCQHNIIVAYDEFSRFALYTYNREDVNLLDATVVCVRQSEQANYYDDKALPMFIPGGLHCGSSYDDCTTAFAGDEKLKYSSAGNQYTYNGPVRFPYNTNNLLFYWYDTDMEEVGEVEVYKNY